MPRRRQDSRRFSPASDGAGKSQGSASAVVAAEASVGGKSAARSETRHGAGALPVIRRALIGSGGLFLALALLTLGTVLLLGPTEEKTLTVFLINVTTVVGIGLFTGNSGILSFGHLSFMGVAAFVAGIVTLPIATKAMALPNLPPFLATLEVGVLVALVLATLFTGVFAFLVGLPITRLSGSAGAIATLGLLVIVHSVLVGAKDYTRGAATFFGIPRDTTVWLALAVAGGSVILARLFRDSAPGLQLRAARDNELAAGAMGVPVVSRRLIAWVLSAIVVAMSGVLFAQFLGTISPKQFYFIDTLPLLAMLIVGGMATVTGAVAGTLLVTLTIEFLRRIEVGVEFAGIELPSIFGASLIGVSLLVLLVLYRRPQGLLGRLEWDEHRGTPAGAVALPSVHEVIDAPPARDLADRGEKLSVADIYKTFDGVTALKGVTFGFARGDVVGLIGPNGSGKTTLLNILSGVLSPTSGVVRVGDRDCTDEPAYRRSRDGIGRTFQNIRLFNQLSVEENVRIGALARWPRISHGEALRIAAEALEILGLREVARLGAATLPYGLQRRVEIARAIALQPRFLLLDEPAAGLNPEESERLLSDLASLGERFGLGILVIDHDLSLIMRLSQRVVVLNKGELIADGTPEEVQKHPAVIEAYLGRGARTQKADLNQQGRAT